jgi:hypothetical protein
MIPPVVRAPFLQLRDPIGLRGARNKKRLAASGPDRNENPTALLHQFAQFRQVLVSARNPSPAFGPMPGRHGQATQDSLIETGIDKHGLAAEERFLHERTEDNTSPWLSGRPHAENTTASRMLSKRSSSSYGAGNSQIPGALRVK